MSKQGVLQRIFRLQEHGTTVRTEVIAGITTFLTMVYIVFVNPQILNFSREKTDQHQLSTIEQPYDKNLFGTAVLRDASAFDRMLLLKKAAHEVYFPDIFDLSSGKIYPK